MKTFLYRFADGSEHEIANMTNALLEIMKERHGELTYNGFTDQVQSLQLLRANTHSKGDGFKPGFHPGLKMEIRSHEQYQKVLKEKGFVEIGNEKRKEEKPNTKVFTEEIIKDAISQGADISGREASKLLGETT